MGRVTDYLISLITKQVDSKGIVIWYDPEGVYKEVVDGASFPDTTVLKYEDSLFRLKRQVEPYLEFITEKGGPREDCDVPPRVLIYVPADRKETQYALIEAESAGVVMEPGAHPWQLNTRLKVVAEHVFKQIAPDRVKDIVSRIEGGALTLKDLDRLSSEREGVKTPTVKIIFHNTSPVEVVIKFLSSDKYDKSVQTKNALPEIADLVRAEFGIEIDSETELTAFKKKLSRLLLMGELVAEAGRDKLPEAIRSIPLPESKEQLERIKHCLSVWRNRADLKDAYVLWAEAVEEELGLKALSFPADLLVNANTFPFIEKTLLLYAEDLILDENTDKTLEIVKKRSQSFWSLEKPEFRVEWSLIQSIANVITASEKVKEEVKKTSKSVEEFVNKYTTGTHPWFMFDRYYRHMERKYSEFDLDITGEHDSLERAIALARKQYTTTLELLCESFSNALEKDDFKLGINQNTIYSNYVTPELERGERVAYVLVDALRYEMAEELTGVLKDDLEVEIIPVIAQVPTLTPLGMASLLSATDKGLELKEGSGKLSVYLNGIKVTDRNSRVKYFKDVVQRNSTVCTLNNLMKPSKKLREELQRAEIVLVTSQEIDRLGEDAEEQDEVRVYMEEVLEKLRKGVRRLASLGFGYIVIASDHGYIFGETVDSGMKIDPPGGTTLELHRRVWIGKGGRADKGFLRVKAQQLGLIADVEIAFPRSLACFKTRGGSYAYFHGGISLQEVIVPLLILRKKKTSSHLPEMAEVQLIMHGDTITTRFFSVSALYIAKGLYSREEIRVRMALKHNKKEVGSVVTATYGFDEGTKEILLKKDEPNHVTFMLTELEEVDSLTVCVYDAITEVELGKLEKIPVKISL